MPSTSDLVQNPLTWIACIYLFIDKVLPIIAPDLVKIWSRRQSTEDKLFALLKENSQALVALRESLEILAYSVNGMDRRLDEVEKLYRDDGVKSFIDWFKKLPAYRELQKTEHSGGPKTG